MGSVGSFSELSQALRNGKVLTPGDEGFEESLRRWSATCVKPAAAVAMPADAEEVSAVVKYAGSHNIAFNVKGGGHSTSQASSAPSPEGMVLDLGLMRSTSVDPEKRTITFGGGCLQGDVDDALAAHGLATPGGTVSHTGVGGLILHGGFGLLSGLYGLTIDNLVSCEVVLADGSIKTTSETENPDLFWALRGAGSSFGVVTSFTSRAYPQGDVYVGALFLTPDKLPAVVEFLNHWDATTDGSQSMIVVATHAPVPEGAEAPPGGRPPVIACSLTHVGADAESAGPAYFEPLLKLEALMKNEGMHPYASVNKMHDDKYFAPEKRYQFGGSNFTVPTTSEKITGLLDRFWALTADDSGLADSVLVLEGIANITTRKVPLSSTAFNNRGAYYNIGLCWLWTNPALDEEIRTLNRGFQDEARKVGYSDAEHKDGVGRYINYVGEGVTDEEAFGANAQKLKDLKAKYDPNNLFDKVWKLGAKKREPYAV